MTFGCPMWIWITIGILLVVVLVVAIAKLHQKMMQKCQALSRDRPSL